MAIFPLFIVAALAVVPEVPALKCYQSQRSSTDATTEDIPTDCPFPANSCVLSAELSSNGNSIVQLTRACSVSKCSGGDGQLVEWDECRNSTPLAARTFCCCYGDGCNRDLKAMVRKSEREETHTMNETSTVSSAPEWSPESQREPPLLCYQYQRNVSNPDEPWVIPRTSEGFRDLLHECPLPSWSCLSVLNYEGLETRLCSTLNCTRNVIASFGFFHS